MVAGGRGLVVKKKRVSSRGRSRPSWSLKKKDDDDHDEEGEDVEERKKKNIKKKKVN